MIIDHIRNLGRYARLFEDADKIAAFFAEHPLEELKLSQSCPVAGTDYILSPVKIEPKPFEEKRWEGHRRHTDLHLVIQGREYLGWIPVSEMKMSSDYAEEPDVGFLRIGCPVRGFRWKRGILPFSCRRISISRCSPARGAAA